MPVILLYRYHCIMQISLKLYSKQMLPVLASTTHLPPGRYEVPGLRQPGPVLYSLAVSWPKAMPRTQLLERTLVLLLTSSPVGLYYLADLEDRHDCRANMLLKRLSLCASYGVPRKAFQHVFALEAAWQKIVIVGFQATITSLGISRT